MPRPPSVSLERCAEQSRLFRASAAACASPQAKAYFTNMADAYDSLAAKLKLPPRRPAHP